MGIHISVYDTNFKHLKKDKDDKWNDRSETNYYWDCVRQLYDKGLANYVFKLPADRLKWRYDPIEVQANMHKPGSDKIYEYPDLVYQLQPKDIEDWIEICKLEFGSDFDDECMKRYTLFLEYVKMGFWIEIG